MLHIWKTCKTSMYEIKNNDMYVFDFILQHYRAVLLIPDIFIHKHVKEMMNLLLDRLGFGAAIVQQVGWIR